MEAELNHMQETFNIVIWKGMIRSDMLMLI